MLLPVIDTPPCNKTALKRLRLLGIVDKVDSQTR